MKFIKLNSRGVAHLILPLLIIVGIGLIGSYVAVKSRSHADSLPSTAVDSNAGQYAAKLPISNAASLADSDGIALTDNRASATAMGAQAASNSSSAATDYCHHRGYDGYSSHYNKCVNLRYSYTIGDTKGAHAHRSKAYNFGPHFMATVHGKCAMYYRGDQEPTSQTEFNYPDNGISPPSSWTIQRFFNTSPTHSKNYGWTKYSNAAQRLSISYYGYKCTHTVHIWQ